MGGDSHQLRLMSNCADSSQLRRLLTCKRCQSRGYKVPSDSSRGGREAVRVCERLS